MPSKFRLRYLFKPLIHLIAKGLIRIKVSPNLATIIMLCFSLLSFISLVPFQNLLCFSIFVFITGIMDGCDGAISRLTNKSSRFGGFFDSFMDRISEFFIFLGLFIYIKDQFLWNLFEMKLSYREFSSRPVLLGHIPFLRSFPGKNQALYSSLVKALHRL